MGLKDFKFKESYDSDEDDLINEFYIPALSNSISYKRISGFFSSSSLAVSARGIGQFILNGGVMELICSANLSKADIEMIKKAEKEPETIIEENLIDDLNNLEEEFVKNHVYALGWMLAKKKLTIKIAILVDSKGNMVPNGILHPKIGILEDNVGNIICFTDSNNETAYGWLHNIEEFKVFPNWNKSLRGYFEPTIEKFEDLWNNLGNRVKVINAPVAVERKLIDISKDFNYEDLRKLDNTMKKDEIHLRNYQKEAIKKWSKNNFKGIFEMATGTGKTFTALGCISNLYNSYNKLLIVISCPFQHLITQWQRQVEKFDLEYDDLIIADGNHHSWKDNFADIFRDLVIGYKNKVLVITTHDTLSSRDFIHLISDGNKNFKTLLIADEMHGLGSPARNFGLLESYDFRLGLSATPKRWLDESGTTTLFDYFHKVVFKFSLEKAIRKGFLTPFLYLPIFDDFMTLKAEKMNLSQTTLARFGFGVQ